MTPVVMTPDEAVSQIGRRDTVGFGLGPGIPHALMQALGRRDDWEDLVLGGALLLDVYQVLTHPGVSYRSGFFGPAERMLVAAGHRVDHVPGGFRQFAPIMARFSPRVMAVQGAPDGDDRINLSLHVGGTLAELLAAGRDPDRLLVVEVNPNLPRTRGLALRGGDGSGRWPAPGSGAVIGPGHDTNSLPMEVVDVVIEADHQPFVLPEPPPTPADRAIAGIAAGYVTDGATLQTGIGAIPNLVAATLAEGSGGGYGVHSEMFTDGLRRLHQAGKVTNDAKGIYDGVSVTTFALGSADLYRWLQDNDEVGFVPVEMVNAPEVIGRNRAMVSLNGALSVDLYGQVAADHLEGNQISGVGGHEDFVSGTELRLDSHSLVCLPSTVTVDGELRSRLVTALPAGEVVSTPRHHLDVVVTEHGAAEVRGLTVRERAEALAAIAHPLFRDELAAAAHGLR
ncbi:MAG: acetyl-CoA hydrolase/transferase family protein [Acidimicrobiales bacterium]